MDENGRRDLNAALDVFTRDFKPDAVLGFSPMGSFIRGFYAARGWDIRDRGPTSIDK